MSISNKGLELLTHFEGCKLNAYQDSRGKWTIGYGTTVYPWGAKVSEGDTLESVNQAIELRQHDLKKFENAVAKLVNVPMDQSEYDALVVLAYNIGTGEEGLGGSMLLKKINDMAPIDEIEKQWMRWVNSAGKYVKGLENRRRAEFHFYKHGELKWQ